MTLSNQQNADEQEIRVRERTEELEKANQALHVELLERKHVENKLIKVQDKLENEIRSTKILHKLCTEHTNVDGLYSVLQKIVEAAIAITGAEKGNIQILDSAKGKLRIAAQRGFDSQALKSFESVDVRETSVYRSVVERMESVIVEDITQSSSFLGSDSLNALLNEGIKSFNATPLVSLSGKPLGIISTYFGQTNMPAEREQMFIDILARQAADVIERKQIEEELRENREDLDHAQTVGNIGSWRLNVRNNKLTWSNENHRIFGILKGTPLTYETFLSTVHPDDRKYVDEKWKASLAGEPYDIEHRIIAEGRIKWVREKANLEFDKNGKLLGGFGITQDITEIKKIEEALRQNEQQVRLKLENVLSPAGKIENLKLSEIVDAHAIQSLMDDFYKLAHIPMSLDDLRGNILVGVGWQDICTKFHRVNPKASKYCKESDTKLSVGVPQGEFKLYKCKNNMWDIATPIIVGGQHLGNIFSGQFFFEDEPLDYELFRSQARKYGFNEEEYIAALEKVPRLSKEAVDIGMAFFMKLAHMLSQISYSNIKLAQSLSERDALMEALQESEEKYRKIVETANEGIWIIDDENRTLYVNNKMTEMLGYSQEEMIGRAIWDFTNEEDKAVYIMNMKKRQQGIDESYELKFIRKDGSPLWTLVNTNFFFDRDSKFAGSMSMLTDITRRKQEEHQIRRYNRILEGINSIFSSVVQAKTEEELGNACLSVALEVTGSKYGFINEMGADGLLHDVAKSELGWEQCLMHDKTGHRRLPSNYIVHGLYGSVVINEKSFFTNDPQSHPDSIGVPPGHPSLTSFLGVPLIQSGKTMGLIAVANRENGYSREQQEDLEAIASTVTQALQGKKAEKALRLSNLYNRSLIEASLDPLVTIGRDGKITDVNEATEEVTGYPRSDLIGTDFSDNFTETEKARAGYQKAFTRGEVRDYPLEIQHKDGHITPVLYNASVYRDENGEIIGVFAAARDIAERKKAEEALKKAHDNLEEKVKERTSQLEMAYNSLKESERGLAEAQKIAHIGSWDWDILTGKVYWSDEMYRIYGRNPQKSGATYEEFLSYTHPKDREYLNNTILEGLSGKPFGIDYRIILASGEERTVHIQPEIILDENNIPVRVKGTVQDITERKKAEDEIQILANALESSNDAIVTESLEGIITSWNKGAEQIYGYSAEEILGKNTSILEPENIKGEIKQLIDKIKQGKRIKQYETSRVKKDGTLIIVSVTLSPIFNASGELVAISAIGRDITESKRAEEALRESETRMRRFYESGMFGVVYYNLDGSITDANDKFLEIVGYTREDLQAGRIRWDRMTPPEYRLMDEKCIAELKATGVYTPYEKEYIRKDGMRVPIILGVATFNRECCEGIGFVLDITELKQGEHRIRRYYSVLEGINRIFGSVVRAETEEELGNVCLSVALEVTGSQTGFICEVGTGRILRSISASNMEWALNLISDMEGNRLTRDDFALHEIYSQIFDSGKSFFTNNPPSHSNSKDPQDVHMLLTSFLGVPLLSGRKTVGLIMVANREGGYSYEQQEDLEAIAPAVIQAVQRKKAEKVLAEIDKVRIKEIHHRIKNNLQVISSLLDLQAEKFRDEKVLEAFRESHNRVLSMSLIHEELYKGKGIDKLDFSEYISKLAENLFKTYRISNKNISLYMDLEENAFFNMDTAVPLGIIVNELISNSLKHAFNKDEEGKIRVQLSRGEVNNETHASLFSLRISDDGKGIPEEIELGSVESLGLQLVNILVDQLDGVIEVKRGEGTEFRITFKVTENS